MTVQFNPNAMDHTSQPMNANSNVSLYKPAGFNRGLSTLSSLAQAGGEKAEEDTATTKPKATKDDSSRSFCGAVCYVLTAPFRFIAYCATSVWNFICCKKDEEVATPEENAVEKSGKEKPGKPVPANSFEKAVLAKEFDEEAVQAAFSSAPKAYQEQVRRHLWEQGGKEGALKDFEVEAAVEGADEDALKEVVQHQQAARKLASFAERIAGLKIKDMKEEEQEKAVASAKKKYFDALAANKGKKDEVGELAKKMLLLGIFVLRGSDAAGGSSDDDGTLGTFDTPVKEAAELLGRHNGKLLSSVEAREAIASFVTDCNVGVRGRLVHPGTVKAAFARLEARSTEATKLLLTCIGHRVEGAHEPATPPKLGRIEIDHCSEMNARVIMEVAQGISEHENGSAADDETGSVSSNDNGHGQARSSGSYSRAMSNQPADDHAASGSGRGQQRSSTTDQR